MKLLLINDNYALIGGAETYLFSLCNLLEKHGHKAFIFSYAKEEIKNSRTHVAKETKSLKKIFESKSIHDIVFLLQRKYIDTIGRKLDITNIGLKWHNIDPYYIEIHNFLRETTPDLIHLNNNYKYPVSTLLSLKKEKIPVIQTVHDFGIMCPTSWGVKPGGEICNNNFGIGCVKAGCIDMNRYRHVKILKKTVDYLQREIISSFITPSKVLKERMLMNGFENVYLIPNFINAADYEFGFKRMEKGNILFIGGLVEHKGIQYLIEAFPKILEEVPEAKLNIIGKGPANDPNNIEDYLKRRVSELKLDEKVTFFGSIKNESVRDYYQKANVVVVPSISMDNSPMVIYEAMASGRPVVGSKIGGIPELIRDRETGYLTEPRNPEDIAKKVIKVLSDRNLAERFGKTSREITLSEYSHETHYENLMKIYQKLV